MWIGWFLVALYSNHGDARPHGPLRRTSFIGVKARKIIEAAVDPKRVLRQINPPKVRTNDGFTLYLVGRKWVDNLDPANVDMTFDAGDDGLPVDVMGSPLDIAPDPELAATLQKFLEQPGI